MKKTHAKVIKAIDCTLEDYDIIKEALLAHKAFLFECMREQSLTSTRVQEHCEKISRMSIILNAIEELLENR